MKVVLVPCGASEWHKARRLLGRVELPLTEAGRTQCAAWAEGLRGAGVTRIYHAGDELATATAACLAERLAVPTKSLTALREVDLGLWAGLTEAQLRTRYPSAHRELCESPLHVQPPGGEELSAAGERLRSCLRKQVRRNGADIVAVVLRPLALALVQCALTGRAVAEVWQAARSVTEPQVMEVPDEPAQPAPRRAGREHAREREPDPPKR